MAKSQPSLVIAIVLSMFIAAVMLQFSYAQSLNIKSPEIVQLAMRGPDGTTADPVYSEAQLTELHTALSTALMESYDAGKKASGFKLFKKADYEINVRMQEVFGGSLMLAITASAPGSDMPTKTWEKVLTSEQDLASEISAFATQAGSELSAL